MGGGDLFILNFYSLPHFGGGLGWGMFISPSPYPPPEMGGGIRCKL